jgi:hypothetical protein
VGLETQSLIPFMSCPMIKEEASVQELVLESNLNQEILEKTDLEESIEKADPQHDNFIFQTFGNEVCLATGVGRIWMNLIQQI